MIKVTPICTGAASLMLPTPGHFFGHTSVIVPDDGVTFFLAGDATYTEANLRADRVDGVTYDPSVSLATLRAIKSFAAQEPTVLLPSHDSDEPARLANRALL
jgi:N-acyl homoserine lactone hydrolase